MVEIISKDDIAETFKKGNAIVTIFDNGDIFLSTNGDVHILKCKEIFKSDVVVEIE